MKQKRKQSVKMRIEKSSRKAKNVLDISFDKEIKVFVPKGIVCNYSE
ncbi:MAG: hypothetical protein FWH18_03785 [Marinilabiliaceae bacterium]|nr:hypothetical protein [Marinilabiliaceae bacterium]